jgi:hypothetical protein
MSAAGMLKKMAAASPRTRARLAGALYVFSLLTAVFGEFVLRGRLAIPMGLVAVAGMLCMTLLIYAIFKPVSKSLSLLATFFSLVGLTFEALRLQPRGVNIAIVFNGLFCILLGYLILKSAFLPRVLGALMAFGGVGWLTYLSPPLANYLSPYSLAAGILGEASLMLWLLVMGVNAQRWKEQAGAAGERQ